MTLKNSCDRSHPVLGLFGHSLKRQLGISLLGTAFLLLICPGILWRLALDGEYAGNYGLRSELSIWAVLIFLISLLIGVILLCYNHSHLFSRKSADLYYALPIKRDSLLAVRFGAALVGAAFAMTLAFVGLWLVGLMPDVNSVRFIPLAKLYLQSLLMLYLCLSTVLIFVVNSGSVFHFIFSLLVVGVGIPLLCIIGWGWYDSAAYGMYTSMDWVLYSSPFAYGVSRLALQEDLLHHGRCVIELPTLLIGVGGSLLFTSIAFLMNHCRKAEKSGGNFANTAVPVIITLLASALGGFAVGSILDLGSGDFGFSFWIFFSLGAALVAVAAGAIVSKGFRKIWRWFLCAGAATVTMLAVLLLTLSAAQKASDYVPAPEEISSVTLMGTYNSPEVTFYEDFEQITRLHAGFIDHNKGIAEPYSYEEYSGKYGGETLYSLMLRVIPNSVELRYTLTDGSTVERSYWHTGDLPIQQLLFELTQCEEYISAWQYDLKTEQSPIVEVYSDQAEQHGAAMITAEEARQLLLTYGEELGAAPEEMFFVTEDAFWAEEYVVLNIYGDNSLHITVPYGFTRTLTLWQELSGTEILK